MIKQRLIFSLCLFLASLVLMSSLHAGQVINAAVAAVQRTDDGLMQTHLKVAPDLHHHMDKSGMQLVKDVSDNQYYADYRTIRALRSAKKELPYRYRLTGWLQDSWLRLATILG